MTLARIFLQEDVNFLLTNRIPRRLATKLMARFSRIRSRALTRLSIAVWQLFADDLRLDESLEQDFESLHACFVRRLKPGLRPIDPRADVLVSPCDALVGARGRIADNRLIQAKGLDYTLDDLVGDAHIANRYRDGVFITLRLQSNMYHRFHAPCDGRVRAVTRIAGDTWNVNPIAVARIERLFCRNERAVADIEPAWPHTAVALVPVAAILVGGIHVTHDVQVSKGAEFGRFEAGSTIILLAAGPFQFAPGLTDGQRINVGQALLHYAPLTPSPTEE